MGQPLAASACDCELATGLGVDRRRIALRTFKATGSDLGSDAISMTVCGFHAAPSNLA
jgi:hypothetical protein